MSFAEHSQPLEVEFKDLPPLSLECVLADLRNYILVLHGQVENIQAQLPLERVVKEVLRLERRVISDSIRGGHGKDQDAGDRR